MKREEALPKPETRERDSTDFDGNFRLEEAIKLSDGDRQTSSNSKLVILIRPDCASPEPGESEVE